jgi:GNAT superfamily N-acetyltransferase
MPIEIRQVSGYEELERWVAARNEVVPDDPDTVELKVLLRASQDSRVDLIAYDDEEVVGVGRLAGGPITERSTHPYVEVLVLERHRGRGVGTALLRAFSEELRPRGKAGVQVEARSNDAYSLEYLERRGFVEIDRWTLLVLELDRHDAVDPEPPDGLELTWLSERPDLLEPMFAVAYASGRDQTASFAAWQVYELGDPRIRLDLTAIALAGSDVVGYTTYLEVGGGRTGCHRNLTLLDGPEALAVGTALTKAQIAAAKRAGVERLFAWARPWQYQALYESLGYEAQTASIDFQGPLL